MALSKGFLENVIKHGKFDLSRVTGMIESGYIDGTYTEEERVELLALRDQYLNPETQAPETLEVLKRMEEKYAVLEEKYSALELRVLALEGGEVPTDPVEPEEYPEWHPWNGIPGTGYKYGAKVTHNGVKYHSEYTGENTWEPGVLGTEGLWVVDA